MTEALQTAPSSLPGGIRWGRALVGALLLEVLLAVASVPLVALGQQDWLVYIILPATAVASVLAGMWVARHAALAVLNGAMVGVMAIALYIVLAVVASLLRPEVADFGAAVSPIYLATHALKVVGGAVGGWLVARKRVAAKRARFCVVSPSASDSSSMRRPPRRNHIAAARGSPSVRADSHTLALAARPTTAQAQVTTDRRTEAADRACDIGPTSGGLPTAGRSEPTSERRRQHGRGTKATRGHTLRTRENAADADRAKARRRPSRSPPDYSDAPTGPHTPPAPAPAGPAGARPGPADGPPPEAPTAITSPREAPRCNVYLAAAAAPSAPPHAPPAPMTRAATPLRPPRSHLAHFASPRATNSTHHRLHPPRPTPSSSRPRPRAGQFRKLASRPPPHPRATPLTAASSTRRAPRSLPAGTSWCSTLLAPPRAAGARLDRLVRPGYALPLDLALTRPCARRRCPHLP